MNGLACGRRVVFATAQRILNTRRMRSPSRRLAMPFRVAIATFGAACALAGSDARATPYTLTPADRGEIATMLQQFFEAVRDGNTAGAATVMPTLADLQGIFQPGFAPFISMHQQGVDRDVRELRARFAAGVWVGVVGTFATTQTLNFRPCGRFANATSECVSGPVIAWRAGTEERRLRIDTLVRIAGHWRLFDPRL